MRKTAGHIARVQTSRVHRWFAAFFAFGATMCALTVSLLLFPGSALDSLWRLNPDARLAFESWGYWSVVLMLTVGTACLFAAIGLWQARPWGTWLALIILSINMVGDLTNVFARHDYRGLIGVPLAAAMICFLLACSRHSKSFPNR
ncbi:MAG TPA: hypothetical protein VHT01_08945 [Candidatus Udaeobacter sp.]|nr:hypothetical protein [Candidatus Udaeobacter sp.]